MDYNGHHSFQEKKQIRKRKNRPRAAKIGTARKAQNIHGHNFLKQILPFSEEALVQLMFLAFFDDNS